MRREKLKAGILFGERSLGPAITSADGNRLNGRVDFPATDVRWDRDKCPGDLVQFHLLPHLGVRVLADVGK